MFKDEIDTLYVVSNKLTQAATPIEQLESISDYARSNGASWGVLMYLEDEGTTEEVVAEWTIGQAIPLGLGTQFQVSVFGFAHYPLNAPVRPTFIQDMLKEDRVDPSTLIVAKLHHMRSAVILPLFNKGRWVAEILFGWVTPCLFDERDQRVYTALQQQAASAIDSVRLFEQTQKRASELETAKREIDILYQASHQLIHSSNPAELLEAVSIFPREIGAFSGQLFYFNHNRLDLMEIIASWCIIPAYELPVGYVMALGRRPFPEYWLSKPEQPIFSEDVITDDRVDSGSREIFVHLRTHGLTLLPLYTNGRWIGVISFYWDKPHVFDDREKRIFSALRQQIVPVIDSIRLFEQTQKRATELEGAKQEIDLLYQSLRKLTRASTRKELLEAVSSYPREKGAFNGQLFYFNQPQLDSVETVATWGTVPEYETPIGLVIDLRQRAFTRYWVSRPEFPTLVSDVMTNELVDETSRAIFTNLHTRAIAVLPLHTNGRWVGVVTFYWDTPYTFSERDARIFTGLHQQLAPVIESIRLFEQSQQRATELEIAKREMDILYSASRRLMQAATPAEQLEAVSHYARSTGAAAGALSYFPENEFDEEVVAAWGNGEVVPVEVGTHFYASPEDAGALWLDTPGQPTLIADVLDDERVQPEVLPLMRKYKTRAIVFLPLHNKGRWIGLLVFRWAVPRNFDERDYRVYSALQQQVAPVVDSVRLFEQIQKRATELESAKREMDILYEASSQLMRATSPTELLAAISDYPRERNAVSAYLLYFDRDNPPWVEVVAEWATHSVHRRPVGWRLNLTNMGFPRYWLLRPEEPTLVPDIMTFEGFDAASIATFTKYQIRSLALLPLYSNGRWIGYVLFCWSTPREFDARDIRVYTALHQQLTPVIDSMRLFEESQERTRWAVQLSQVNADLSQATDEQEILGAVSGLVENLDMYWATLAYTFEVEENKSALEIICVALRSGTGDPIPLDSAPLSRFHLRETAHLRLAIEHPDEPVFIENVWTDTRPELAALRTYEETQQWPAIVVIPLKSGDQWQGLLSFYWEQPQVFTPEIRSIFSSIMPSATSVVAIRRAYLAEQDARKESELLYSASQGINRATTVDEIIKALEQLHLNSLAIAVAVWENYDRDDAHYLEVIGLSDKALGDLGARIPEDACFLAKTMPAGSLLVIEDTKTLESIDPVTARRLRMQGHQALIWVPLVLGNRCLGLMAFDSPIQRKFTKLEKRLASGIGELVTAALERIRLKDESDTARHRAEKLAAQAQKLAALEERTRLARELHDSVSQALYGIGLGARTARVLQKVDPSRLNEPLDYILSLAEAGLTEMRALIFELRPESLEQEGIVTALSKQATSVQARHNIQVKTNFCEEPGLPLDVKEDLYRIAREALHNIVKHAQATHIGLSLLQVEDGYQLEICDNGIGFDMNGSFPGHLGLQSMRERTAALKGDFHIESTVGKGTRISVVIWP